MNFQSAMFNVIERNQHTGRRLAELDAACGAAATGVVARAVLTVALSAAGIVSAAGRVTLEWKVGRVGCS
jgi:hypothetical protein